MFTYQLLMVSFGLVAVAWAAALTYFDIRHRRLPDFLTLPAGVVMLVATILSTEWNGLWGLIWPLLYFVLALLAKGNGIGGGDIKLAVPLGMGIALSSGAYSVILAVLITSLLVLPWGVVLRWRKRRNPDSFEDPPNGPAMLLATAIVLFTPLLGE